MVKLWSIYFCSAKSLAGMVGFLLLALLSLSIVQHGNIQGHLLQMVGIARCKREVEILEVLWCSVVFWLWKTRNKNIFENVPMEVLHIIEDVKFQAWSWLCHKHSWFKCSFVMWSTNPSTYICGDQ